MCMYVCIKDWAESLKCCEREIVVFQHYYPLLNHRPCLSTMSRVLQVRTLNPSSPVLNSARWSDSSTQAAGGKGERVLSYTGAGSPVLAFSSANTAVSTPTHHKDLGFRV